MTIALLPLELDSRVIGVMGGTSAGNLRALSEQTTTELPSVGRSASRPETTVR